MGPQGVFQCRILSCHDSWQLAELTTSLIPRIWTRHSGLIVKSSRVTPKYAITNTNIFKQYCFRLFKDTKISSGCILLALYYLEQLRSINPSHEYSFGSEFRLFTIALILANKYLDDNTFTNKTWSEVTGIALRELNVMEMEYLDALNYTLHVHCLRFCSWVRQCECWISTPTIKRSSSLGCRPQCQDGNHSDKHSSLYQQPHYYRRYLRHFDLPTHHYASTIAAYRQGGGAINKKSKKGISPSRSCHPYLPTSSSSTLSISIPSPLPKQSESCPSFTFSTPPMNCSSSLSLAIPHSGATAAVNATAYVNSYHPQHGLCYISSNLVHSSRYWEIE